MNILAALAVLNNVNIAHANIFSFASEGINSSSNLPLGYEIADLGEIANTEGDEASSDSTPTCEKIESEFQTYLLKIIKSSQLAFNESYQCASSLRQSNSGNCNELNASNLQALKEYRTNLKKLYQELTDEWIKERSLVDGGMAQNCYGTPAKFKPHFRLLSPQIDPSSCQGMDTDWYVKLDTTTMAYLNGEKKSKSLTSEQIAKLKAFHMSPIKRLLSDGAIYDQRLSDGQLKKELATVYNNLQLNTEKLYQKMKTMENSDKYVLYSYANQYESYLSVLDPEKRKVAELCRDRSGYTRECVVNVFEQGRRCLARVSAFLGDLVPIKDVIDAFNGFSEVMAEEASGALTREEANNKRSDLAFKGALGLTGIPGVVSVAGNVVKKGVQSAVNLSRISAKDLMNVRAMAPIERAALLARTGALSDTARIVEAESIANRVFTEVEKKAVLESHRVGAARGAGYGTYTMAEIRQKLLILKDAGFSQEEITQFMRRGVTGMDPQDSYDLMRRFFETMPGRSLSIEPPPIKSPEVVAVELARDTTWVAREATETAASLARRQEQKIAADLIKDSINNPISLDSLVNRAYLPVDIAAQRDLIEKAIKAMNLTNIERRVFYLRNVHDLTVPQIADELGLSAEDMGRALRAVNKKVETFRQYRARRFQ